MKNTIIENITSNLIVTTSLHQFVAENTHFMEKRSNPLQLTSYMRHSFIPGFNTGASNNTWLLSPCHKLSLTKAQKT